MEALEIATLSVAAATGFGALALGLRKTFAAFSRWIRKNAASVSLETKSLRYKGFSVFELRLSVRSSQAANKRKAEAALYFTFKTTPAKPSLQSNDDTVGLGRRLTRPGADPLRQVEPRANPSPPQSPSEFSAPD